MHFTERLRRKAEGVWSKEYAHPFVQGVGSGKLDPEKFQFYLKQDYVYLNDYSRLLALAVAKARDFETMGKLADLLNTILNKEVDLLRTACERYGIPRKELDAAKPSPSNRAYMKHLLDAAYSGSFVEILTVLLPCAWGYAEIAPKLKEQYKVGDDHPYKDWINFYASDSFQAYIKWLKGLLDRETDGLPERELQRLEETFLYSSKYEYMFWDMSYRCEEWPI